MPAASAHAVLGVSRPVVGSAAPGCRVGVQHSMAPDAELMGKLVSVRNTAANRARCARDSSGAVAPSDHRRGFTIGGVYCVHDGGGKGRTMYRVWYRGFALLEADEEHWLYASDFPPRLLDPLLKRMVGAVDPGEPCSAGDLVCEHVHAPPVIANMMARRQTCSIKYMLKRRLKTLRRF